MENRLYTTEDIEVFNKILQLNMSEERKKILLTTFRDRMSRAEALDAKMSKKPYSEIVPSNIFLH